MNMLLITLLFLLTHQATVELVVIIFAHDVRTCTYLRHKNKNTLQRSRKTKYALQRAPCVKIRRTYWLGPGGHLKFDRLVYFVSHRLDFDTFSIAGPSTSTLSVGQLNDDNQMAYSNRRVCTRDTFAAISPGSNSPPVICGENKGEHSMCVFMRQKIVGLTRYNWFYTKQNRVKPPYTSNDSCRIKTEVVCNSLIDNSFVRKINKSGKTFKSYISQILRFISKLYSIIHV